ncbi:regulator of nonsense transcripts 2 [Drosophila ficusphila]|uniref:regulator of nonsense transcripts 2 n=1 Tax=Drosophila ficusphila TaxID=30025 RepID=UPI0007E62D3E|nr:regulator of nonsense transcripts 2 [Drosophila ficusphila]XP_017055953.1 regulator of nonsense transcripts 2 [Drosophila ficusphila]XP_017055954.1 regulator of nonsense transcripts 2 [Drosophila ficusphila]
MLASDSSIPDVQEAPVASKATRTSPEDATPPDSVKDQPEYNGDVDEGDRDGDGDADADTDADAEASALEAEEREELQQFINELRDKIESKRQLRLQNSTFELPGEEYFAKLDSNLKKNTAFVKKLKLFTATQLESILRELSALNLSKYISEICAALAEAKLKMTDVPAVVTLASRLHCTYADFDAHFLEAWQKALNIKASEKIANPSKLRVDLRLFAELVSSGVIQMKPGLAQLGVVLVHLIAQDKDDHSNFSIILSFCRHCGEEYAGLVPQKMQQLASKYNVEVPKSDFLGADKQLNLRTMLKGYFKALCKHVLAEQAELMNMTKNIRRTMECKGEISTEKREKCELMQAGFDKLLASAQSLSELLGEPLPELAKESECCNPGTVIDNMLDSAAFGVLDPWGDDETRAFYTDLPDLRQFLPNFSAPKVDLETLEEPSELTEEAIDANLDAEMDLDDPPSNASDTALENASEQEQPTTPVATGSASCDADVKPVKMGSALMELGRQQQSQQNQQNPSHSQTQMRQQFDSFLVNLFNCVNKELIDSAAIEFLLNFNTKHQRKKLTRTIFSVQRTRLDILPYLSRFVAIVHLCNTDMAADLTDLLRKEFKWHIRKKNQLNIESKLKIVRFIGELVKFGLFKKFDALGCLKMLLRDFQHHQIEMACAFVEVSGVYLYNCRDSRLLMNVFLDQMLRLKTATAMDSRHAAQIESVYYLVKPPESAKREPTIRPPMHEYIRHLIFEELCKQNVERCIKMLRRIDWQDPETNGYAIKCLSKAYLLRFPLIRCLADLVSGLSSYQPRAVTIVIDNVFEDIRAGLEIHSPRMAQRRIAMAKYLGEMYNYKLVESTHILNTLYSIISLGVSMDQSVVSPLDPPDSLFRLKLACMLLDTCGPYFTSQATRKKLDYFLVFFQHYYWFKKSHPVFSKSENTSDLFPILVDHTYRDCLAGVRPKLKLYKSLEQAKAAIDQLQEKLYPQLKANSTQDPSLATISEISELDDGITDEDSGSSNDQRERQVAGQEPEQSNDWTENEAEPPLPPPPPPEKSKEDLEFEHLYEKMTTDSYQERLKEPIKATAKDIPVPMMARLQKKSYDQITGAQASGSGGGSPQAAQISKSTAAAAGAATSSQDGTPGSPSTDPPDGNGKSGGGGGGSASGCAAGTVPFVLMVRGNKGGKQQFKSFVAPSDSHLAINLKLQEQKIREEKEKVKRLTLNITERIEEEDYQESLLPPQQRNFTQSYYQKPNKHKFKHQKGAPDADLIFH